MSSIFSPSPRLHDLTRKEQMIRVLLFLSFTLCLVTGVAAASPTPVRLGFMTWYQAPHYDGLTLHNAILANIRSTLAGVNREGGIYGVPVELVTCDINPLKQSTVEACAANLTSTPYLFSIVHVISDDCFRWTLPYARAARVVLGSPLLFGSSERYPFENTFFFVQAEPEMQLRTLVKMAVNTDLNKRIGVVCDTSPHGISYAKFVGRLLGELGVSDVAYFNVNTTESSHVNSWSSDRKADYEAFLATRPQGVIVTAELSIATAQVLGDIFAKSIDGNIDRNIKLFTMDTMGYFIHYMHSLVSEDRREFSPTGRIFVTAGTPFLQDPRYSAARHAFADMVAFNNGSTGFTSKGIGHDSIAMIVWTTVRMLTVALRSIPGGNMTRVALQQHIFNTNFFAVDDLLLGPFSGKCEGVRAEDHIQCECNRGYHVTEVYAFSNLTHTYTVHAARTSSPTSQCSSVSDKIEVPLVYLVAHQDSALATSMSQAMLAGQAAQEVAPGQAAPVLSHAQGKRLPMGSPPWRTPLLPASFYHITAPNTSALTTAIVNAANNKYLSVLLASVVDPSSDVGGLPLIDPITVPARLSSPFVPNVLLLSATLEQEIHTLCLLAVKRRWTLSVFARGEDAHEIVATAGRSANTFGFSLTRGTAVKAGERFSLSGSGGSDALLALGLAEAADVDAIRSFLSANLDAAVFVSFAELSALFSIFASHLPAQAQRRVFFASSLPHWNSSTLSPPGYFASISPNDRSPLSLRGFVASAAVQKVIPFLNGAVTPSNFLKTWYLLTIIVIEGVGLFGPFSNITCTTESDTLCDTNIGARAVHTACIADMTLDTEQISNVSASILFSSGRIDYRPLPTADHQLHTAEIAAIILGLAVGIAFLLVLFRNYRLQRNTSAAPKNASVPFTLCFTDIQDSTALWAITPEAMAMALNAHHDIVRRLIRQHCGYEVKTVGDGFMVAFINVKDAVDFAISLQKMLFAHDWKTKALDDCYKDMEHARNTEDCTSPSSAYLDGDVYKKMWNGVRVRVGIHIGTGEIKQDEVTGGYDYYGTVANVASKTEASGHGGQILVTKDVMSAMKKCGNPVPCAVASMGEVELRGVPGPVELFELQVITGRSFPPMRFILSGKYRETKRRDVKGSHVSLSGSLSSVSPRDNYLPSPHLGSLNFVLSSVSTLDDRFEVIGKRIFALLLSTAPNDERDDILKKLCKFWRLKVALPNSVTASQQQQLADNPYMAALCRKLAPILRMHDLIKSKASTSFEGISPAISPRFPPSNFLIASRIVKDLPQPPPDSHPAVVYEADF